MTWSSGSSGRGSLRCGRVGHALLPVWWWLTLVHFALGRQEVYGVGTVLSRPPCCRTNRSAAAPRVGLHVFFYLRMSIGFERADATKGAIHISQSETRI